MEVNLELLKDVLVLDLNGISFLKLAAILTIGSLVLGLIGRFVFGKKSVMRQSVTAAIGILFIYAVTIVLHSYNLNLGFWVSPLPFISVEGETLTIFSFAGASYTAICAEVLNMIILGFLVNILVWWLPVGKKLIVWLFCRVLSVALGLVAYSAVMNLLTTVLPDLFLTWAPVILLGIMLLTLLLGALKGVVGAVIATANPLLGVLYTFFFSTLVGKLITKSIFTTAIIGALVYALNYFGVTAIAIGAAALLGYLPLLIILLVLWYIVGRRL